MSYGSERMERPERERWRWWPGLVALAVTGLVHLALLWVVARFDAVDWFRLDLAPVQVAVLDDAEVSADLQSRFRELDARLLPVEPRDEAEPEPEPPPPPPLPEGQIVETVKPEEERVPTRADYLDSHDNAVPEEMRSARFKVNPDVLSNVYARESRYRMEDLADVGATEFSTGATAGGARYDAQPGPGPPRTMLPSQWSLTNKEGLAAPTVASSRTQELAGAPQNDLLDEKIGPMTALNTRKLVGAEYYNRIRRLVNFYWGQNLDNLPSSTRVSRTHYSTVVDVVLTADGALDSITVTSSSGLEPIDRCVVDAFRIAGPFPNPPEALISADGRVYLPDFDFNVNFGRAQFQYRGIDPRAGVQFPGITKSPR